MKRKRAPRWFPPVAILFVATAVVFLPAALRSVGERIPLKVRAFRVQGAKALSAVDLQAITGLREGVPLFGRWPGDAAAKVQQHPRVERVAVARDVTGKVVVRVSERKAAATANLDRLYFVDRQGNLLEEADPRSASAADLVVFTGPWTKVPPAGFRERILDGFALKEALEGSGVGETEISELHFDAALGWVVYRVGNSARVVVGRGDYPGKSRRLARVLRDLKEGEEAVREIDVSFRNRAVVKLNGPAEGRS